MENRSHILGATFDSHFNFSDHINTIFTRASSLINIFKALADTNLGQQNSNHPYYLKIPYPTPYHVRRGHIVSKRLKINDPET